MASHTCSSGRPGHVLYRERHFYQPDPPTGRGWKRLATRFLRGYLWGFQCYMSNLFILA